MKILDPGHDYVLQNLDGDTFDSPDNRLTFVKRDTPADKYPGNVGHHSGTTIQEVMRAVINRLKYVNQQIPCGETDLAILNARQVILQLERRAARRHGRVLQHETFEIELVPTCPLCGHIECNKSCRV